MAENIKRHITHIKSKVVENGNPKLPTSAQIELGEIAVNYAKDKEVLSIKNESGTVVTFSSDNYYTEQKLGSGFTGANSANTVTKVIEDNERVISASLTELQTNKANINHTHDTRYYQKSETSAATEISDALSAISQTIEDNEYVTAAAINDLQENKLDTSAYTSDMSNYYQKSETSGKTEISTALAGYVQTGRTITTASGLTGGGNLSANRTIGLAATGTSGTYRKVTTDAYGRVTAGTANQYVANLQVADSANYITEPEIKSVKINGSSTNAASTNNCSIQYDTTNKCLKFIFN